MRRVIAIAVAGASLAGCSSFSFDSLKPTPPPVQVQLDSIPSGADAVTSLGPGCRRPARFRCPRRQRFLRHLQPAQVPADHGPGAGHPQPRRFHHPRLRHDRSQSGGCGTQAGRSPPRATRKPMRPKRPKPPKAAAAPAAAGSPFPTPASQPATGAGCHSQTADLLALHTRTTDCRRVATCLDCVSGGITDVTMDVLAPQTRHE